MNTTIRNQALEKQLSDALKSIARRQDIKEYIDQDPLMNRLLRKAADRYVTGEHRSQALITAKQLESEGYAVSLEYIGENTDNAAACEQAVEELTALIDEAGKASGSTRVSFDLSHIGLLLDTNVTLQYLLKLARQAEPRGVELFISMEESAKTDRILSVYTQAVKQYPEHIGITLQAHLHRTPEDVTSRLPVGAHVRIVKGAYQEQESIALPRSEELDTRYMKLVEDVLQQGCRVSVATHDEVLIDQLLAKAQISEAEGYLEYELLYGIRPELSRRLLDHGYPVRIYLTYGHEWYLYLCHRIAEYPPNLFQAVVDMVSEDQPDFVQQYVAEGITTSPQ
ncbi:proline dehydrogenase family protein [Paenibacillus shenyangensis]|uniref:proline dehydrogenase family protein n=1 Tax=Paenibacillus sp. A9 TaxID=1284352 RepID=UPI000371BD6E|nr:proline dehydrogenase family protein [Paenibacillus sp. A9]